MSTPLPFPPASPQSPARKTRRVGAASKVAGFAAVAALVVGAVTIFHHHNGPVDFKSVPVSTAWNSTSNNWSGYAETSAQTGQRYTDVAAEWTIPAVSPTSSSSLSCSSQWAGVGGATSKDLIQLGTSSCTESGQTGYYAWYEILPASNVAVTTLNVAPGDRVVATLRLVSGGSGSKASAEQAAYQSVVRLIEHYDPSFGTQNVIQRLRQLLVAGESRLESEPWFPSVVAELRSVFSETAPSAAQVWQFHFQVTSPNGTVQNFTKDVNYQSSMSSAEWITEAPTDQAGIEPLPNYGVTHFLGIAANGGTPGLSPSNEILLADPHGEASIPSQPVGQVDEFNTCYFPTYHVNACPAP